MIRCAILCATAFAALSPALAETDEAPRNLEVEAGGILPALSALFRVPDSFAITYPDEPDPPGPKPEYTRLLPFGAQKAIDRGFLLPKPLGVALVYTNNQQPQDIRDLSVAIGKGEAPPPGTDLTDLPFVRLDDVDSDTESTNLKVDAWVLPNLNVFTTLGRTTGDVDLDVVVDTSAILPERFCNRPGNECGEISAPFSTSINANTLTIGATGVYGWRNYFGSLSGSYTFSFGENSEDSIRSTNVSLRGGRRWQWGDGNIIAPFAGLTYFEYDQEIEATASLKDVFPDGDSIDIRWKARTQSAVNWFGALGVNVGLKNGTAISLDYSQGDGASRFTALATVRF